MLLRPAEPADAMAVARVHVRAWQVAYRDLLPDDYLDEPEAGRSRVSATRSAAPIRAQPMTTVALDERGTIRGFVTTCAARDQDVPGYGEARGDPRRSGLVGPRRRPGAARLGSRLSCSTRDSDARSCGCSSATFAPSASTSKDGWAPDGTRRTDTVWGVQVDDQRYRRML